MLERDITGNFKNSLTFNYINDDKTALNYKAFATWVCGFKVDNKEKRK